MKSLALLFTFVICTFTSFSQIDFEKGYYVANNGNRVEGSIKNVDWDNNPADFLFQRAGDAEPQRVTIEQASEFGIDNVSRFVRATLDVDLSSDNISELTAVRNPDFKKEQLFLKALVQGKASLYSYVKGDVQRFFFETDAVPLQQLVYKSYLYNGAVSKNLTYREQLRSAFQCETPTQDAIMSADYSRGPLTKLFLKYNNCIKADVVDFTNKNKYDFFNLWLRPRVTSSSFTATDLNVNGTVDEFDFETQIGFSAGVEAEFILPFNRNKWAIMIEPTYQSYEASIPSEPIRVDYKAIELPLGLRHYFFLNDHSKLSLGFAFQVNFPMSSTVTHFSNVELKVTKSTNMAFEAGYVFRNRLCAALRYQTDRELLGGYGAWASDFGTVAFVLGYSPF